MEHIKKKGISVECTMEDLCKVSGKYNKKEIAGAFYVYTQETKYLDDIDYQRILRDDNRPVIPRRPWRNEVKNHAHHICYKRGKAGLENDLAIKGHKILRKYGIDPVLDPHNLIPAPNTGHCPEEIEKVVEELRSAENEALKECKKNGLKGKEQESYIRDMLYQSLEQSGEEAQKKSSKKKGKNINEKKLCRN